MWNQIFCHKDQINSYNSLQFFVITTSFFPWKMGMHRWWAAWSSQIKWALVKMYDQLWSKHKTYELLFLWYIKTDSMVFNNPLTQWSSWPQGGEEVAGGTEACNLSPPTHTYKGGVAPAVGRGENLNHESRGRDWHENELFDAEKKISWKARCDVHQTWAQS